MGLNCGGKRVCFVAMMDPVFTILNACCMTVPGLKLTGRGRAILDIRPEAALVSIVLSMSTPDVTRLERDQEMNSR
jgi:hypothetical protein